MNQIPWPLAPMQRVHDRLLELRRIAFDRGVLRARRVAGAAVVSVGAITCGGAGKTPVTGWLAWSLMRRGLRIGVVGGAYMGAARARPARVASDAWLRPGAARDVGDEALLLARWLPGAVVVCGRDKLAAARQARVAGAEAIVLDDGFQHLRLHRDLDIVLAHGEPGHVVPGLHLREGRSAQVRADLRWAHLRDGAAQGPPGQDVLSRNVAVEIRSLDGRTRAPAGALRGQRVFLLAAVAWPAAFRRLAQRLGARVVGQRFRRDHTPLTAADVRAAARARADCVLCTEKDAVRLGPSHGQLHELCCKVELLRGRGAVEDAIAGALARGG